MAQTRGCRRRRGHASAPAEDHVHRAARPPASSLSSARLCRIDGGCRLRALRSQMPVALAVRGPMSGLPSGTVTFLFTDIEGSTQRWQQQPAAMGPALARHDRLVREAIEAHGGVVFKTVGDAFCAA